MTKLFDDAIAKPRELPAAEQDAMAVMLLTMAQAGPASAELDDDTRAIVREGLARARQGRFASDEDVEALWKSHGV